MEITNASLWVSNVVLVIILPFLLLSGFYFKKVIKDMAAFWTSDPRAKQLSFMQFVSAIFLTSNLTPQSSGFKKKLERGGLLLLPVVIVMIASRLGAYNLVLNYFLENTETGKEIVITQEKADKLNDPFGWKGKNSNKSN
ncbi:MAG: hypothetical protein AB8B89_04205 [Gammaproteobacteria bacterium]